MSEIKTVEELEALYGTPIENVMKKETPALTTAYRRWLEQANFFTFASVNDHQIDCSPRGDAPGEAFAILSNSLLAIPDRRGNNRLDTLKNIVRDPRVSLLFMIPGINETLRIKGKARLTTAPEYIDRFDMEGKKPLSVILVDIEAVYFQCARALKRAQLWNPDMQIAKSAVPSAGQMVKGAVPEFDGEAYDCILDERQNATLY